MQLEYLRNYIIKGEAIEESEVYEKDGLIHVPVKIKKLTTIYLSKEFILVDRKPDRIPEILQRQFTRRSTADFRHMLNTLSGIRQQQTIIEYLGNGFIYKVIEYRKRGMEVKREYFIPSKYLQDYWKEKLERKVQNSIAIGNEYCAKIISLKNKYEHPDFDILRKSILKEIAKEHKINKKIDFFTSVLIAASQGASFDWREIGLYSLGNRDEKLKTKVYDNQKNEFLRELQKVIGEDFEGIGLTTVSGDYSAEFCARCKINFGFGAFDYIEAEYRSLITDEEIFEILTIEKKM